MTISSNEYRKQVIVGIDPGVNTGIAIWDRLEKKLRVVTCVGFIEALDWIDSLTASTPRESIHVRYEDARLRKWFGSAGREQLQGAGSIKRDCQLWEEFLTREGLSFEKVPPKNNKTKTDGKYFKKITGWEGRTNSHSRDAAMLVFNY
jgi:hypothetical protein